MQRKNLGNTQCPVARSLERVGEWWSILILRDAVYGLKRFDEFQKSLEIAPNMLTRRLNGLVQDGLLERQRYSDKPPRYEYVLTNKGRDFRPVLVALLTDYVFHSKAAINVALAIVTVVMASLSALAFGLVRRLMGACILEGSRE